jgi:hypothetical protein
VRFSSLVGRKISAAGTSIVVPPRGKCVLRAMARRKARDSFSIVVNFDQSGSRSSGKMPDDTKTAAGAIAVALQLSARCVIVLLLEGDCHIELQLEGDHNVGRFD